MAADVSSSQGPLGLVGGLFQNMIDLMGDKAGSAVVRFAAVQEGQRLGASYGPDQLAEALARVDGLLGQHSRLEEDGRDRIVVQMQATDWEAGGALEGILAGLLEGVLQAVRKRRYTARFTPDADGVKVEMEASDD